MSKWIWMLVGVALLFGGLANKATAADPVIEMLQEKGVITADEAQKLYDDKAKAEPVVLSNAGSKLTMKGRFFGGYYVSDEDKDFAAQYGSGSNVNYKEGSFEVPDGKLQFTWNPMERISVVTRLSFGGADNTNLKFDYLYGQYNGIIPGDRKSRVRLGKMKVDFGEETFTDNAVENNVGLISNSAAIVGGYDEGIELYGNFIPDVLGYTVSLTNGSKDTGIDSNPSKAIAAKLFFQPALAQPLPQLYFSGSYYTADMIDGGSTDFKIANITSEPTGSGTDGWNRSAWEVDAKSKFFQSDGKTEIARLAAAYGQFTDEADGSGLDREGSYYFLEGMYNFTPKFFVGARCSVVSLDDEYATTMNGISKANEYTRTSLGMGYRLNKLVTLKAEYSWNDTERIDAGTSNKSLSDNLLTVGLAAAF